MRWNSSHHTHWLAAQCDPHAKASQRVCLPSPGKEIFKNALRTSNKEESGFDKKWTS